MRTASIVATFCTALFAAVPASAQPPDLILHHGKVVTVDEKFSIAEAIAVRGERIVAVGKNEEVLKTKGEKTQVIDLAGNGRMQNLDGVTVVAQKATQ